MSGFVKMLDYPLTPGLAEEPSVRVLDRGTRSSLVKTASEIVCTDKLRNFIKNISPTDGKVSVLVNAMGAGEYYGPNINGDYFPEDVLREFHPTFVSDGKPYMHHVNKDPNKCYGNVIASDYNDKMHRVELIIEYDTSRLDNKYVDKINGGDVVSVSMGCRVPWDICSICNNKASSPSDYCKHLKSSPGMGKMMSDGKRAYAVNLEPTFFDISIVTIPADQTARIMSKIATENLRAVPSSERARQLGFVSKTAATKMDDITKEASMLHKFINRLKENIVGGCGMDHSRTGPVDIFSKLRSILDGNMLMSPMETQSLVLGSDGMSDIADKLEGENSLISGDSELLKSRIVSAITDSGIVDKLHSAFRDDRDMGGSGLRRVVIKITIPTSEVEDPAEISPEAAEDLTGLSAKTASAVGALTAAFQRLQMEKLSGVYGLPKSSMAGNYEGSLMCVLEKAAALLPEEKTAGIVGTTLNAAKSPLGQAAGFAALSGLLSKKWKDSAMESSNLDYNLTGKFKPGLMARQDITWPATFLSLVALRNKLASAEKNMQKYARKAEELWKRPFADICKNNAEEVFENAYKFIVTR